MGCPLYSSNSTECRFLVPGTPWLGALAQDDAGLVFQHLDFFLKFYGSKQLLSTGAFIVDLGYTMSQALLFPTTSVNLFPPIAPLN